MKVETITQDTFKDLLIKDNIKEENLPALFVSRLMQKGLKVATAESCTGGLISKLLTDRPGVSQVFDCSVCSYANSIKEKVLGVGAHTLIEHGAVSPETALEMAQGIRSLADADVGISTTGVAGPTGGTEEKPVGLVYIGIVTKDSTRIIKADFCAKNNNRDKNRQLAASLAIYCAFTSI